MLCWLGFQHAQPFWALGGPSCRLWLTPAPLPLRPVDSQHPSLSPPQNPDAQPPRPHSTHRPSPQTSYLVSLLCNSLIRAQGKPNPPGPIKPTSSAHSLVSLLCNSLIQAHGKPNPPTPHSAHPLCPPNPPGPTAHRPPQVVLYWLGFQHAQPFWALGGPSCQLWLTPAPLPLRSLDSQHPSLSPPSPSPPRRSPLNKHTAMRVGGQYRFNPYVSYIVCTYCSSGLERYRMCLPDPPLTPTCTGILPEARRAMWGPESAKPRPLISTHTLFSKAISHRNSF